jgi:hypothetical protein
MTALLVALLAASPPVTLAALELEAQQVPPAMAKLVGTHLAQALTLRGLRVVTAADLAALLGAERQRNLLGCNEESSCIAEIGAALNARGVVVGSVGRLGEARLLNVKVLASANAETLAACSGRAGSDEGLLSEAETCADLIAAALLPAGERRATASEPRRSWALAPLIGGAAVAIGGGVLLGLANADANRVPTSTETPSAVFRQVTAAEGLGTTGLVLLGVGSAAAVTGAVLFAVRPAPVQPVVLLTSRGGFLSVSGAFP